MMGHSLLGVFPEHPPSPPHPPATIRLNGMPFSVNTSVTMHVKLILVAFLACVDIAEWVGGAIFHKGWILTHIMSDPGFLKAPSLTIPIPSEQWASEMTDLNEN